MYVFRQYRTWIGQAASEVTVRRPPVGLLEAKGTHYAKSCLLGCIGFREGLGQNENADCVSCSNFSMGGLFCSALVVDPHP